MNKDLSAFLNANGFQRNGASGFFGTYKGFQFSSNTVNSLSVAVYLDETAVVTVNEWIKQNKRNYSISAHKVDGYGIGVTFSNVFCAKKMIAFIGDVSDYLATVATVDVCPFCGERFDGNVDKGEPINIDCSGNRFRIHDKCYDDFVKKAAQADAEAAAAPGNYLKGALGMLLGSLAGGAIFIGLYLLGYIAWIAPLAAAFLGSFLYGKFGGKNDKKKIIILWAVTLVVMGVCIFLAIILNVYIDKAEEIAYAKELGLDFDFFEALQIRIEDDTAFRNALLFDTIFSSVLLVAADAYMTYIVLKTQKPQTTLIKRLG